MISFNKTPIYRLLIPLCIGITLGIIFPLTHYTILFAGIAGLLFLCCSFIKFEFYQKSIRTLILSSCIIFIGLVLVGLQQKTWLPNYYKNIANKKDVLVVRLLEPLSEKKQSFKTFGEVIQVIKSDTVFDTQGKIVLYFDKTQLAQNLRYASVIYLPNKLHELHDAPNPNEFSPKQFLKYRAVYESSYLRNGDFSIANFTNGNIFKSYGYEAREYCMSVFKKNGLSGDELAVVSAMIVGYDDDVSKEVISAFSASGAMHLLSVSGLHIAFVYIILTWILRPLRKLKYGGRIEFVITVLVLWFYAIITGFSPPVLRSAIMFSAVVYAKTFGKYLNMFNVLAFAAIVILVVEPLAIADVGFQLSFLALLSILIVQPKLTDLYYSKNYLIQKTWEIVSVSIAATVGTLPFTLYYFHQFPNYFLFVNILVIPLSTLLLYAGFAVIAFSWIPPLSYFLTYILKYSTMLLNCILLMDESLPFSVTKNIQLTEIPTLILIISTIMFCIYIYYQTALNFRMLLFSITAFFIVTFMDYLFEANTKQIVFYSVKKHIAVDFISNSNTYFVADDELVNNEFDLRYHIYPNRMKHFASKATNISLHQNYSDDYFFKKEGFISCLNTKVCIPNKSICNLKSEHKVFVDFLVLNGLKDEDLENLLSNVSFRKVVIEPVYGNKDKSKLLAYLTVNNFKYWDIQKQGALVIDL